MAWIEFHQQLGRHPKVLRLAGKLHIHPAQVIGHLAYLWWWSLDYVPNGDLSASSSTEIASAATWPGDADKFLSALKVTGWIDENGMIHDWMEYAGRLIEERRKDADRKRQHRIASAGHPPDGGRTAPVPNPTIPNSTQPNQKIKDIGPPRPSFQRPSVDQVRDFIRSNRYDVEADTFHSFYESNGWKVGRNPMKDWKASVRTWHGKNNAKGGKNAYKNSGGIGPRPGGSAPREDGSKFDGIADVVEV